MPYTEFRESEPSGSEEENCLIFVYVFYFSNL